MPNMLCSIVVSLSLSVASRFVNRMICIVHKTIYKQMRWPKKKFTAKAGLFKAGFINLGLGLVRSLNSHCKSWKSKFSLFPVVYNLIIGYAKRIKKNYPRKCTLGTRGFSRVRREFSVLAEGRPVKYKEKKPGFIALSGPRTTGPG